VANIFDDFRQRLEEAKIVNRAADVNTLEMVKLCKGRLRMASENVTNFGWSERDALTKLKKELRDWNMTTGTWK